MNDDIIYRFEALAQDADGTVTPFVLRVPPDLGSIGRAGTISGSIARTFVANGIEFSVSTKRSPARWRLYPLYPETSGRHRCPHP